MGLVFEFGPQRISDLAFVYPKSVQPDDLRKSKTSREHLVSTGAQQNFIPTSTYLSTNKTTYSVTVNKLCCAVIG